MATQNKFAIVSTIQALEDLNSHQYFAVAFDDGKVANNSLEAGGIILNKPKNGEHIELGVTGEFKFRAGAAVTASSRLRITTSGYFITGDSGYYDIGRAKLAVTSGSVGVGFFEFSNPRYRVSSL